MARRIRSASVLGMLLALVVSAPAMAGGWAQAQLDAGPPPGGEEGTTEIGFTLLQHGVTPVDWGAVSVIAVAAATGETVRATAQSDGGDHWTASVAFPSAGAWAITIVHDELEVAPKNMPFTATLVTPGAAASTAAATGGSLGLVLALVGFVGLVVLTGAGMLFLGVRRREPDPSAATTAQPGR